MRACASGSDSIGQMYAFHSKSFLSSQSRRSSSAIVVRTEAAPEDELLGRSNGRDRVDLEEPEPSDRVEDVRRGSVEELCPDRDAPRLVRRDEVHGSSGSSRQRTPAELSDSRRLVASCRAPVEPVRVARSERRRRSAVRENRQPDGDEDRREDQLLAGEIALFEKQQGEDDRCGTSRTEPAEEGDRRSSRTRAEHRDRDRQHAHDRQAEDGVERDLPGEIADRRTEQDRPEDEERHGCEHRAGLLHEVRDVAATVPAEPPKSSPPTNGADEARAADRLGESEREQRARERDDLEPRGIDPAAAARVDDDGRDRSPGEHPGQDAVADLLEHDLGGRAVSDRTILRVRNRERDEEERHADAVVQAALDVEALADPHRKSRQR